MRQKEVMDKPITSFGFDARNPIDREVLSKANQYCSLFEGIPALSCIRNLLLRTLPREIEKLKVERN